MTLRLNGDQGEPSKHKTYGGGVRQARKSGRQLGQCRLMAGPTHNDDEAHEHKTITQETQRYCPMVLPYVASALRARHVGIVVHVFFVLFPAIGHAGRAISEISGLPEISLT